MVSILHDNDVTVHPIQPVSNGVAKSFPVGAVTGLKVKTLARYKMNTILSILLLSCPNYDIMGSIQPSCVGL